MSPVELIYDRDCPNVAQARKALREAFARAEMIPAWSEWDRKSPASPNHVRGYGSPTVLVDGRDVVGAAPAEGADCCRVYLHGDGILRGVPPVGHIAEALRGSREAADAGRVTARPGSRELPSPPGIGAGAVRWPIHAVVPGYGPLVLGAVSVGALVVSEFVLSSDPLAYGALAGLIAASAWIVWPKRARPAGSCPRRAAGPRSDTAP